MNKTSKKLALKKESLRNLSEAELGSVNGGTALYVAYNYEWNMLKMPSPNSGGCTTAGCAWAFYNYKIYY
jgi:hypothetical protein